MSANISMFSDEDAFNIGLQRTAHFKSNFAFRLWATMGVPHLLRLEAKLRRESIINGALRDAGREFATIGDYLGERHLNRIVDIGCGQALIDLFFWRKFHCSIHLVDIEETKTHHHDFHKAGAGYASLAAAKKFLIGNDVDAQSIQTTNPQKTPLMDTECDLIFSLLSCGFHYPASTYSNFISSALKPGGMFIFDMRKNTEQDDFLEQFETFDIISVESKYRRIAAIKAKLTLLHKTPPLDRPFPGA
jgi:hypothetical protein